MLSHNFNIKDLDFIKLWSEFQLTGDMTPLEDDLKTLALQGQPNAIAKWYEYFKPGKSPELDNKMENFNPQNFEEYLAKGYYEKHIKYDTFKEEFSYFKNMVKSNRYLMSFKPYTNSKKSCKYFFLREEEQMQTLKANTYLSYFRQASKESFKELSQNSSSANSLYLKSRAFDILLEYAYQIPKFGMLNDDRKFKINYTHDLIKKSIKNVLKQYTENSQKFTSDEDACYENPQFYFAVANLISTYLRTTSKPCKKLSQLREKLYTNLKELPVVYDINENDQNELA